MEGSSPITNAIPIHEKVSIAPSESHRGHWIIWQWLRCKRWSFLGKDWHYCWWFSHALKGKESASSVDNECGNTGGGGSFLLRTKKIIGIASGVTDEKEYFLPPKGVLGGDFPLPLKAPLSSLKSNVDGFEQPSKNSASSPTVNKSIGLPMMSLLSSFGTPLKGAEVFASIVGVNAPNMTGPLKTSWSH